MFREQLPRIYELRDLIEDPALPGAAFQNIENTLHDPSAMQIFAMKVAGAKATEIEAAMDVARKYADKPEPPK